MIDLPEDPTPAVSRQVRRFRRRHGHADGWYVSAKDYDSLASAVEQLEREVGELRAALAERGARIAELEAGLRKAEMVLDSISDMKPGKFSTEACAETALAARDGIRALLTRGT
jgi:hypothetical protein